MISAELNPNHQSLSTVKLEGTTQIRLSYRSISTHAWEGLRPVAIIYNAVTRGYQTICYPSDRQARKKKCRDGFSYPYTVTVCMMAVARSSYGEPCDPTDTVPSSWVSQATPRHAPLTVVIRG